MRFTFRWKTSGGAVLAAATLAVGLAGYAAPAGAAPAGHASPAAGRASLAAGHTGAAGRASLAARFAGLTASGGVSAEAELGTPQLNKTGTNLEVIRQLVQCGQTMYAVGRFTQINQLGAVKDRNNVFSFGATSPYPIKSWNPDVNGQVNAIAFNGSDCSHAYIGGKFTSVHGTTVSNIAEIDTATGKVVPGFGTNADNEVWTMVYANGHLLTGGDFIHINGTKENHFASLSPVTGADDGFIHLNISGTYDFCAKGGSPCTDPNNRTQVYNQQLSHTGTLDLVEGRFTSVGGLPRQQIFMLNLAGAKATVTGWTSPEWDGSNPAADPYYQCWPSLAFYVRSAAWSPDDSTVYLATTGFKPAQNPGPGARLGLCDSVSAWPSTPKSVTHNWVEYSGCDSYYSVAADSAAVYAAGHPRWANNSTACNAAGQNAFPDPGLQGLDPATGIAEQNSGGTALYTMTRANADSMLITSTGLWISSTNRYTVNKCGDLTGPPGHNAADHAGICFLSYP